MEQWTQVLLSVDVIFLSLLLLGCGLPAQSSSPEVCPTLGSNIQTQYSQSSRERLFINFGAPAQCNGTVTSWRYCSYNTYQGDVGDCVDREYYTSVFLVYRQTGPSTYEPVPGSSKSVTISLRCPSDGGFRCDRVETLSQSEQFTIQENDIVAACLMDTGSTNPIRLVGYQSSGTSSDVYQYNANNYEDCTTSQLQSIIDVQNSVFTFGTVNYRLHLYAETNSPVAQCSGGSNPPPFTASVSSGTYLNTASPITCTDTITSWHYCYYPSAAADSSLTYTATVGVWRLNAALDQYELLSGSNYNIQLVQPVSTPAKIFCKLKTEILQPQDYVRVQSGDIIGVFLPTLNPLPIVASGATGYSLTSYSGLADRALQVTALSEESNMALHLHPTIVMILKWSNATDITNLVNLTEFVPRDLPTTELPTTTQSLTTQLPIITQDQATTEPPLTSTDMLISSTFDISTEQQTRVSLVATAAGTEQQARVSLVATAAGSVCGALIIFTLSVVAIIAVVVYFKCRLKAFNLTSNVAYSTGPGGSVMTHNDEDFSNGGNTINNSSQDQTLATPLYDTIEDTTADLAQQPREGAVPFNLAQNAAYNPLAILSLSSNAAYESHMYEHTVDYEYI